VDFRPGDVLLIRTGFLEWYVAQPAERRAELAAPEGLRAPGVEHSEAMARYLWNTHVSAVAADCPSVEVWPRDGSPSARPFGFLHTMLLGQFGMALGEQFWLRELAEDCASDGVHEMFFTAAPLNVVGGIGSPANALAIK
jgi:kynurenine formamidase